MARDPLATVARLRRLAQDDARQALAQALAHEAQAADRANSVQRDIASQAAAASSMDTGDAAVEAFAAWLPGARQQAAAARDVCERAGAEVGRLRAVLSATRAALEGVETLIAERSANDAQGRERQAEAERDDAGRPRPDPLA